jgi:hypothetical protein
MPGNKYQFKILVMRYKLFQLHGINNDLQILLFRNPLEIK